MTDKYQEKVQKIINDFGDWFNDEDKMEDGKMSSNLYPYTKLFEPIMINKLKIKNRIVMGPMGNVSMADETGKPTQKMIEYYIERAKGGAGLITSGMTPVFWRDDPSYGDLNATGIFPRIDSHRSAYSGWRAIVEGSHTYGARFFIQLAPGMGRVGNPECMTKKFKMPVSSSWNPNWYIPQIPCRPITDLEIKKIIHHTGQIAIDAKEIGIDGIYLHGHSGYLIEQMTDPAFNRRKLGHYANWQNFGLELVKEIRKRCGKSYPIHYRIDLTLGLKETYGDKLNTNNILKKFKNGRTPEMTIAYMKNLVEAGVDAFDIDLGGYDNWWMPHPPNGMPPGVYIEVANMIKEEFSKSYIKSNVGVEVPIIAVGKLGFPDVAERALRNNKCDMIMLSRPLLADPAWPQKVYSGRVNEIIPCIGDHEGCLGQIAIGGHPHCAVNPRTAFEEKYAEKMIPTNSPKKIAVVGAGPAGVILACTAAKRGHEVTLYDKNSIAGGTLIPGSVPKIKYELKNYVDYLNSEIAITSKNYKLTTVFNTTVDGNTLKEGNYNTIVTCTGAKPLMPKVAGINQQHVVSAIKFLTNPSLAQDAKEIIVIGGSDVGCEIAYMISHEMNKSVTVVEMQPHFMKNTCTSNKYYIIHHLEKQAVKLMNCTILKKVNCDSVLVEQNVSETVPDPYITWTPTLPENIINPFSKKISNISKTISLKADLVIISTGSLPDDSLYEKCISMRTANEIYNIGDSFSCGRVLDAVKAGYALGRSL